eukprot:GILJ01011549.1.p1 GENE.GILJ01011549.1~~GILJ01011549.1.p1  ORF type:complete len:505 (+),score=74.24 GILJ01011549.1:25-1515(+)
MVEHATAARSRPSLRSLRVIDTRTLVWVLGVFSAIGVYQYGQHRNIKVDLGIDVHRSMTETPSRWLGDITEFPAWFNDEETNPRKTVYVCDNAEIAGMVFDSMRDFRRSCDVNNADILWLRDRWLEKKVASNYSQFYPHTAINFFKQQNSFTDKGELKQHMQDYEARMKKKKTAAKTDTRLKLEEFYRPTYRLFNATECAQFFAQLSSKEGLDNMWILKPTDSSQGEGVEIVSDIKKLRKDYLGPDNRTCTRTTHSEEYDEYIVQSYITKPLLLEGRKSEFRLYWLLANVDPLMVYVFNEGTVRLNSQPYKLDDWDNALVHITNTYRQKTATGYDPSIELKWSFSKLQNYLAKTYNVSPTYLEDVVMPRAKEILVYALNSTQHEIAKAEHKASFGLFGADFIIDSELRPWLTELQLGPGLSFDSPIKRSLIPEMLAESLRVISELQDRRRGNVSIHEISSASRFVPIINMAAPSPYYFHLPCGANRKPVAIPKQQV